MDERTEDAGLSGVLTITIGGQPVNLRVLSWARSDEWLATVTQRLTDYSPTIGEDLVGSLRDMVTAPLHQMWDLVLLYDEDHAIPSDAQARLRPAEVRAAFEKVTDVADPFGEASRLAVEAYGHPLRVVREAMSEGIRVQMLMELRQALSTSSLSTSGDSDTTASDESGPPSSSSSDGPTSATGSRKKPANGATQPRMASRPAMQPPASA